MKSESEAEAEAKIRYLFEQDCALIYKESPIDENRWNPMILNDAWVVNINLHKDEFSDDN